MIGKTSFLKTLKTIIQCGPKDYNPATPNNMTPTLIYDNEGLWLHALTSVEAPLVLSSRAEPLLALALTSAGAFGGGAFIDGEAFGSGSGAAAVSINVVCTSAWGSVGLATGGWMFSAFVGGDGSGFFV